MLSKAKQKLYRKHPALQIRRKDFNDTNQKIEAAYIIVQLYWLIGAKSFGWSFYPESYDAAYTAELIIIALIMSGLALVRHKANIIRLIHGNENKFFKKK